MQSFVINFLFKNSSITSKKLTLADVYIWRIPIIADSFGAWSDNSIEVFDLILKRAPERNEISYPLRKNFFFAKLSISIQRNNARSILNKQQQTKEFNVSYKNDNFSFNNLVNYSPLPKKYHYSSKDNIKKKKKFVLVQKSSC